MRSLRLLLLAALVAVGLPLLTAAPASAATIPVTTTADVVDAGDGLTSLREAINQSESTGAVADTISLAFGATYQLTLCTPEPDPNNVAGDLDHIATGALTIQGNGSTIEQTCAGERIFDLFSTPFTLRGLTLTGGDHDDGAVVRFASDATFDDLEVVGNEGADLIKGTVAPGYEVEVIDSAFVGQSSNRNAIDVSAASLSVSASSFRDFESAAVTSGLTGAPVFVTDSTFVDNGLVNPTVGGGVSSNGAVTVSGSSFVGNVGGNGSAVRAADGGIDVDTSTFYDNHVDNAIGGALYSIDLDANDANNEIELSHVTLWDNTSLPGTSPANLEHDGPLVAFASIVGQPAAGDSCQNSGGATTSEGYNLDRGDSCGFGAGPGDAEDVASPIAGTIPGDAPGETVLVPGFRSAAVDRIPNAGCVGTIIDQRGQLRPTDGDFDGEAECDAGAIERLLYQVFNDVSGAHPFFEEIGWMGWEQISTGYPGLLYKPSDPVSRQAMSAFLYRLADASFVGGTPTFSDVPASNPFFDEIEWMDDEGITTGFAGAIFRPLAPVTRQAMSAFMHRLAGEPPGPFPDPGFSDVAADHPFFLEISWMADSGVSEGYDDGTFRPGQDVSRQAMSAFMFRFAQQLP